MKAKTKKRRRTRNQGGDEFPIGRMIPVQGVRFNGNGTISVVIADADLPASLRHTPASENRKRRNTKRKSKAKRKNTKRKSSRR